MLLIPYVIERAMNRGEETIRILEAVKSDRFRFRDHAVRRGDERMLSREHVIKVAETMLAWKYQEEKFTHWFVGFLEEGRPGGFTAIVDGDEVWVVTVFKRRLSRREKRGPDGGGVRQ
jgi:hypothetical protein